MPDLRAAVQSIGGEIEVLSARTNADIDGAFADLVQKRTDALIVENNFLFRDRRTQILTLAARHAVPVIYGGRDDAEAGGLMSYGPERCGHASAIRHLYRPRPQGRETGRPTGHARDPIRIPDQPVNRQDPWHRRATDVACPRRRGDRVVASAGTCCIAGLWNDD